MAKATLTKESAKERFNLYWFIECLEGAIKEDNFSKVKLIVKNARKQLGDQPLVQITLPDGDVISISS